jgi:hypothetical protein
MINVVNAYNSQVSSHRWVSGFLLGVALVLFTNGCSKDPAANERASNNTNSANSNRQDEAASQPLQQPTLKGDIERAALAISMARSAARESKWQDAGTHLQTARKAVEVALTRQSNLSGEFEALKSAIDRAIPAIEGGGKDAEARIAELQTRIGALKVQTAGL